MKSKGGMQMALERYQGSPAGIRLSSSTRPQLNPLLGIPATKAQAREAGELAIAWGLASIFFGLVLLAMLPRP
jgi:hypothetical protein